LAYGLSPPGGENGESRFPTPTVDHDGEQAVKEGLQPLVAAGDELMKHLCKEGEVPTTSRSSQEDVISTPPGLARRLLTTMSRSA
jgi:hypothetical protein